MAVTIKSAREIELMIEAGKILGNCHNEMADKIKAGMSAYEIDQIAEKLMQDEHADVTLEEMAKVGQLVKPSQLVDKAKETLDELSVNAVDPITSRMGTGAT